MGKKKDQFIDTEEELIPGETGSEDESGNDQEPDETEPEEDGTGSEGKKVKLDKFDDFFLSKEKETGNVISQRTRNYIISTTLKSKGKSIKEIWEKIYG